MPKFMKKIAILGSTGSIGTAALDVIRRDPGAFHLTGLAAGENVDLLLAQINEFKPDRVVLEKEKQAGILKERISGLCNVLHGEAGLLEIVTGDADLVLIAIPGIIALLPTLEAIDRGKNIALASKEILVTAGREVISRAARSGSVIIPVDSEHSAVFQCLQGEKKGEVDKIILTASGGPFLHSIKDELKNVKPTLALNHPRWNMGRKVSLDSATMMNKGLEVLEAKWLFNLPLDRIEVIIHPQSVIHSMVMMRDGSIMAQMSSPDMRLPIAYAIYYPDRAPHSYKDTTLSTLEPLTFEEPDRDLFPALALAYRAGTIGGTLPAVMNAANEVAGNAFLHDEISFLSIMDIVEKVMALHQVILKPELSEIIEADRWARAKTGELVMKGQ